MPDRHEPDIDEGLDDRVLEALAEASAIEPSTGLRDRVLADVRTEQRLASAPVAAPETPRGCPQLHPHSCK